MNEELEFEQATGESVTQPSLAVVSGKPMLLLLSRSEERLEMEEKRVNQLGKPINLLSSTTAEVAILPAFSHHPINTFLRTPHCHSFLTNKNAQVELSSNTDVHYANVAPQWRKPIIS